MGSIIANYVSTGMFTLVGVSNVTKWTLQMPEASEKPR
jgi:hypothetical protein